MHASIRGIRGLLAVVLATLVVLVLTPSAQADFRFFEPLRNQKNESFCIGISGASKLSGARAGLFNCDGTGNQAYKLLGDITSHTIAANHSKLCLRIKNNSTAVGAQVVQGSCTSVSARWTLTNLSGGRFSRLASIKNRHTGQCIGVPGGQIFHDADIQVFPCDEGSFGNQNWVVNQNQGALF